MKKIKVLRFSSKEVYNLKNFNEIEDLNYDKILNLLLNQKDSGRLKSWFVYLNDSEFEFKQFISDSEIIQNKWCSEKCVTYIDCFNTIINQIMIESPDVVFIHDYSFINKERVIFLKNIFPNIKWITYWGIAVEPYKINWDYLGLFDLVLAPGEELRKLFEKHGLNTALMKFGLIPQNNMNLDDFDLRKSNILFAGSVNLKLGGKNYGHFNRLIDLCNLAKFDNTCIIFSNVQALEKLSFGNKRRWFQILRKRFFLCKIGYFRYLLGKLKKPIYGEQYFELLEQHKVVFNPQSGVVGNIRFVEAAYCGNVTLTNLTNKQELDKIFGENNYLSYGSEKELREIVNNLKNNKYNLKLMAQRAFENVSLYYDYEKTFDSIKQKLHNLVYEV